MTKDISKTFKMNFTRIFPLDLSRESSKSRLLCDLSGSFNRTITWDPQQNVSQKT